MLNNWGLDIFIQIGHYTMYRWTEISHGIPQIGEKVCLIRKTNVNLKDYINSIQVTTWLFRRSFTLSTFSNSHWKELQMSSRF